MILDKFSDFASAVALSTAGAGTTNVGDCIDLGTGLPAIGDLDGLDLVIEVTTDVTSGVAATVQFQLVTDSQAPPRTDGNEVVIAASAVIPKASLVAGYTAWQLDLPEGLKYERYIGIQAVIGVGALTAGAVNAFLTPDSALWTPAKAGI